MDVDSVTAILEVERLYAESELVGRPHVLLVSDVFLAPFVILEERRN